MTNKLPTEAQVLKALSGTQPSNELKQLAVDFARSILREEGPEMKKRFISTVNNLMKVADSGSDPEVITASITLQMIKSHIGDAITETEEYTKMVAKHQIGRN